jgi:hypothetical protein
MLVGPQKSVTLGPNLLIYHRLTLNRCISYDSRTTTDRNVLELRGRGKTTESKPEVA